MFSIEDLPVYVMMAAASAFFYALHGTLIAKYLRSYNPLLIIAVKGLLIGLFTLPEAYYQFEKGNVVIEDILPVVGGACLLSMVASWCLAQGLRAFPVGVTSALGDCARTVAAILIAILFFHEHLSHMQLIMVSLIIGSSILLGLTRTSKEAESTAGIKAYAGIIASILFGVMMGISMIIMGNLARITHPLVLTFLIELCTGLIAAGPWLVKVTLDADESDWLPASEWTSLFITCLPSVAGTCLFSMAAKEGSLAIVAAVLCIGTLLASALSHFLYKERLSRKEYALISASCIFIGVLKVIAS